MPTKDQRIADLEKEVQSLRDQLKYCNLAIGGKLPEAPHGTTEAMIVPVKSSETKPTEAKPVETKQP